MDKTLPACPVETTLSLISDRWKVLIIRDLLGGTKRFGELRKSVGNVSQKVLTANLRSMEEDGLLTRRVYAEVPPRVERARRDVDVGRELQGEARGRRNGVRFERLADTHDERYNAARALCAVSFPYHEQRDGEAQAAALASADYRFELIYDGDEFAGLMLCWEAEDFIYVEHFCTAPELRGRGIGAEALALLAQSGKKIILEIDPPVDEISRRRKNFYERVGFAENPFAHVHPPYHAGYPGHPLVVMSHPRALTDAEYRAFDGYLKNVVMKDVKI